MHRYWLIKLKRLQVVFHHIFESDPPDLHDHSWWNISVVLKGRMIEHTPAGARMLRAGSIRLRRATDLHRLEILEPTWTMFITGREVREWGYMTRRGWKQWERYIAP